MLNSHPFPAPLSTAPLGPQVSGFIPEVTFWRRGGVACCELSPPGVLCWEKYDVHIDDIFFLTLGTK